MDELRKEIRELRDAISNIYQVVHILEPFAYLSPHEQDMRRGFVKDFIDFALIHDPSSKLPVNEVLSYLIHFCMNDIGLYFVPSRAHLEMEHHGYHWKEMDGKFFYDGLAWNPQFERLPLIPFPGFKWSDHPDHPDQDSERLIPPYFYNLHKPYHGPVFGSSNSS